MRKMIALAGIAAFLTLNACTALTSTKDASSSAQLHDTRQRMRHGRLMNVAPTNYGTQAMMEEQHPIWSAPANKNTTWTNNTIRNPTAGNQAGAVMVDAPWNKQPAPTAGNMAGKNR